MTEPIINYYYKSGEILSKSWFSNGKLHRTGVSARIEYYKSGKIHSEKWCLNGKLHRTDGPAAIYYYNDGKVEDWFLNDVYIRPKLWLKENGYTYPLTEDQQTEFLLRFA